MYDYLNILIQVTQNQKGQYSTAEYLLIQMASSLYSWVISLTMSNQCTSQDPFLQITRDETLVDLGIVFLLLSFKVCLDYITTSNILFIKFYIRGVLITISSF